jgi:acetyl esterase
VAAGIHPQVQALIDADTTAPGDDGPPSLEALRSRYLQLAIERGGAVELVDATEDIVIAGSIKARTYTPLHGARVDGLLVWLHGGGWILGDIEGFDRVCRSLANAGGMQVVSVDYRLAPECLFPAAVEDADAAVAWALERGGPVVIGGDSAGGNLAAVAALHHREALAAQTLVYPALDPTMCGESFAEAPPMLSRDEMAACWQTYRGECPDDDPDLSPLRADLAGAPPAYIAVAGHDVLRSDGEAYAAALEAAGVAVDLVNYEDMTHGFLRWGGVVDRSRELIAEVAGYAAAALTGSASRA